ARPRPLSRQAPKGPASARSRQRPSPRPGRAPPTPGFGAAGGRPPRLSEPRAPPPTHARGARVRRPRRDKGRRRELRGRQSPEARRRPRAPARPPPSLQAPSSASSKETDRTWLRIRRRASIRKRGPGHHTANARLAGVPDPGTRTTLEIPRQRQHRTRAGLGVAGEPLAPVDVDPDVAADLHREARAGVDP